MPTLLRVGSLRFYFYSHEPNEPPHVHVDRNDATMKVGLASLDVAKSRGFRAHEIGGIVATVASTTRRFWRHGMAFLARVTDERVLDVRCDEHSLIVDLMDGRTISVPLAWYPRLLHATRDQRSRWENAGGGYGIHWPALDEDLSTEGLLRGAPAAKAA